jgi:hypothetical protein
LAAGYFKPGKELETAELGESHLMGDEGVRWLNTVDLQGKRTEQLNKTLMLFS